MSVNYYWILCYLSPEDENELRSIYQSDYQKAIQKNDKHRSILEKWHKDPDFLSDYYDRNYNNNLNEFIQAFTAPSFQDLKKEIMSNLSSPERKTNFELNEANCFKVIVFTNCDPVNVLWYGLGPELADRIPGFMGNIFLSRNEIEPALKTVTEILDRLDRQKFYERMPSVYVGVASCEEIETDIENILTALAIGLESAKEKKCGFLALSCSL